ncbi:subtilisin-like serine protease QhpE [Oceanospirillum linum]|uniref:Peptidase S8/S53 domain-containing protein n=1 Tax=Oceanospirillum linum TaxID=966 RepID=A0A1T1HDD7_OCELI|nr:S8 family serine peptidase [Oceanospirillum linum]OOV87868.1 hypothetical protein BTA35_0207680 [Oceanospirillum linum]SEG09659.1 hypothetical protein SAMN04489856_10532 [Oleiphilus messinensis]SMP08732.1 hypothetical protein SAMN06264348_10232 [Oceanospirillum linum]
MARPSIKPGVKRGIRVGIIDSGFLMHQAAHVAESAAFVIRDQALWREETMPDQLGHGSRVLAVIRHQVPMASFYCAQVFQQSFSTTTLQLSAAIDWLVEQEVDLINLSLGVRQDKSELENSVLSALRSGVLLAAANPAQGAAVYPAAYPGVFRMTGDARCQRHEWSYLETAQGDFGGHVKSLDGQQSGASMGTAWMTGHIAHLIATRPEDTSRLRPSQVRELLRESAAYKGLERKTEEGL